MRDAVGLELAARMRVELDYPGGKMWWMAAACWMPAACPNQGGTAQTALNSNMVRRDADQVLRSLISMGLSPDRVSMSAATSAAAQVNEVHLYVR